MTTNMTKHYTFAQLLRCAWPSIAMMVFTSLYVMVDGFFVSNFAGKTALAAVNWAFPILMVFSAVGFMMGTGGSALVAKTRGEGNDELANRYFSMITLFTLIAGIALTAIAGLIMEPTFILMGATGDMLGMALFYGYISLISLPLFMLQNMFQALFVTAGKPKMGLMVMVAAGVTNMVLDAVIVGMMQMGIGGAAIATVVSEYVGGLVPLVYFGRKNDSLLSLRRTNLQWRPIAKTCVNGSSEMVNNIAIPLVSMLFNFQLLRLVGVDGVAAYSAVLYVGMVFGAILMGFTIGTSPLISFQYGAGNKFELKSLFRKSLAFMGIGGVAMFLLAELCAPLVAAVFTGYDQALSALTIHAFRIYALCCIPVGVAIFGSSLFTALNNGVVSALISFLRTLVFEAGAVVVLPELIGVEGVWLATPVAELGAALVSTMFIIALGHKYGFLGDSSRYPM